ncbi:MAG: ribonucleoside triphosphate reductase, partial [Lachnospiraceae bacterium]|nr:ribonucleoside triphosphate reductase [Lachnospiraceae bacterium]
SICRDHGYLVGEQYTCPHCGKPTEVYSRITGYYRPVQNWNDGKAQEFKDRRLYDIGRSTLRTSHALPHPEEVVMEPTLVDIKADPALTRAALKEGGEVLMIATRTCPNCLQASHLLDKAGIPYRKLLAEENMDLAKEYDIRQSPTLIIRNAEGETVKLAGLGSIRSYINEQ